MKMSLCIKYVTGEESTVDAVFADFGAFERTWSRSVQRFETEVRLTDLAWLAWNVETRAGRTKLKFDPDWTLTVETVELSEGKSEIPLEMTQSTGS